ncbi:MAG: DUF4111 domain-containing protein [Anaerolineae bacterium]|nr:DUF4111 domain-containing protein [Anaerolineae bacterium]
MERILDKNLIGLYLYGSLVSGDFDPDISDIDLLAVTSCDIGGKEFEQLRQMQNDLVADNPRWKNRIEIQYLSAGGLHTFKTRSSQIAVISPGEPFNLKEAGIDWLINWYLVREQGLVLFGPNPQTIIPSISKEEFLQASREHTHYWVQWAERPRDRKGQSYAILTLCRALYTVYRGEQASKRQAAFWAQKRFPQWASLIQNALAWRKLTVEGDLAGETPFSETVQFIRFAVDRIERVSTRRSGS